MVVLVYVCLYVALMLYYTEEGEALLTHLYSTIFVICVSSLKKLFNTDHRACHSLADCDVCSGNMAKDV